MTRKLKALAAVCFMLVATVAVASVLSAAEELAEGIEHLDGELHRINAPKKTIEMVHHTEETCFEFYSMVVNKAPYHSLKAEFNHIRTDMREIRREMQRYHYFHDSKVRAEFWHAWTAYRYLDHEFYHGGPIRHT